MMLLLKVYVFRGRINNCHSGAHGRVIRWQRTQMKESERVERGKKGNKEEKYKYMQCSGAFLLPLCRGTAVQVGDR